MSCPTHPPHDVASGELVCARDAHRGEARRDGTMTEILPRCAGWQSAYACLDWDKPAPCVTANIGEPSSGAYVLRYLSPTPTPHYRHVSEEQVLRLLSEPTNLEGGSLPSTLLGAILGHSAQLFVPEG